VALASGSLAVAGPGWYYIPYNVPFVTQDDPTQPNLDRVYVAGIWDTSGIHATLAAAGTTQVDHFPPQFANDQPVGGPDFVWYSWSLFSAGNAIPNTPTGGTTLFPVEPVIVRWNNQTALSFVMPAIDLSVNVTMAAAVGLYLRHGVTVQVQGAGVMLVSDTSSDPVIGLINIGDPFNAPVGTVVAAGSIVN
jgi:hypothetical protein